MLNRLSISLFRISLKKNLFKIITITLLTGFLSASSVGYAQQVYVNSVNVSSIKTVRIHPKGEPLLSPNIELNSTNKLRLSFDDLSDNSTDYSYRLLHCNAAWQQSNLVASEYLATFDNAIIEDFENSINTLQSYTHYWVDFPNEEIKPKVSGNYILQVYDSSDPDRIVLTRRFRLFEQKVVVQPKIKRPVVLQYKDKGQEVRFNVLHPNFEINDPDRELKVYVEQNQRTDNLLRKLKPMFVQAGKLEYASDVEQMFLGGDEFRKLNIQNIRFQTAEVDAIRYQAPLMHFQLRRMFSQHQKQYSYEQDLNGNFLVSMEGASESEVEADYVKVHFQLEAANLLQKGSVYIFGALSDWQLKPDFQMVYNQEKVCYETDVLLKQGYYNFQYVFFDGQKKAIDTEMFEGSYFQTENDYYIYIYYYDWDAGYDRLIGYRHFNSVQKL